MSHRNTDSFFLLVFPKFLNQLLCASLIHPISSFLLKYNISSEQFDMCFFFAFFNDIFHEYDKIKCFCCCATVSPKKIVSYRLRYIRLIFAEEFSALLKLLKLQSI